MAVVSKRLTDDGEITQRTQSVSQATTATAASLNAVRK